MNIPHSLHPNYIHLNKLTFAEYDIIYHVNDCYAIKELSSVGYRDQLLFQKFKSKIQQMNLIVVDTIFPIFLADVALTALVKERTSFSQYSLTSKFYCSFDLPRNKHYLPYKFKKFINYLAFSNIASETVCKGEIQRDWVYYLKNSSEEIKYYSIYDQFELQNFLFERLELIIDTKKSTLVEREVTLNFKIRFS